MTVTRSELPTQQEICNAMCAAKNNSMDVVTALSVAYYAFAELTPITLQHHLSEARVGAEKLLQAAASIAPATTPDLRAIIDGMVLVCGRTGDAFYDFEEQAEAFQRETGMMRPGKDMPMDGSGEDNTEKRRARYSEWVASKIEAGRAVTAKESRHD